MRKLILTRGAPGSGKSTVLEAAGLAPFALSMDLIRHLHASPIMLRNGDMGVDQARNDRVADIYRERAEERMLRGELLALDATMPTQSDFNEWMGMARRHRYEVLLVDFSGVPIEEAKARNRLRNGHRVVPEGAIDRMYRSMSNPIDTAEATVVAASTPEETAAQINAWLDVPLMDLSGYRSVVHIGDLQGCLSVLINEQGPLADGFKDDTAYIFIGDLVDRGAENGVLVRWVIDHALDRPNVFFLWGNHEDHLDRFARGLEPVSPEFRDRTLPQLIEAGVTPEEVGRLRDRFLEVLPYVWHGQKVMACHAGLASVPNRFADVSLHQYARGTGHWEDPVDAQFDRHSPPDWIQVHGHRNHGGVSVQASERSFNLEDAVEFGGHLRTVTLDEQGWTPGEYRNDVFLGLRKRPKKVAKKNEAIPLAQQAPAWMERASEVRMDDETLQALREHPGVRAGSSKSHPHVEALNFTKQVFFQASWDDLLVRARGLFINRDTQEIVARGYEKFFNVNERPETQLGHLLETMAWPVTGFVKENGYLGNLGYDAQTKQLFIASKSTPDGDFAQWFKEIFEATVTAGNRERIRRWLRDNEASMVFEVIDPIRDPHMIDYDGAHLVLLDVFHRSATPEKLEFEHLKEIAGRFGLVAKQRAIEFKNPKMFEGWYRAASSDLNWRQKGRDIEGLVLEDRNGFQTKVKLPHYAFWKRMRSAKERMAGDMLKLESMADDGMLAEKERILALIEQNKALVKAAREQGLEATEAQASLRELGQELTLVTRKLGQGDRRERVEEALAYTMGRDPHPLAQAFLTWCREQSGTRLKNESILQLRAGFLAEAQPDPALWQVPWEAFTQETETKAAPKPKGPKP